MERASISFAITNIDNDTEEKYLQEPGKFAVRDVTKLH